MLHASHRAAGEERGEVPFATLACALVRQAPTLVAICDARLRPRFLNEAGRAVLGLSPDAEIEAFTLSDFVAPRHRALIEEDAVPAVLRDGCWQGEVALRGLTGPSERPWCAGRHSSCGIKPAG